MIEEDNKKVHGKWTRKKDMDRYRHQHCLMDGA
jgi:hypothetical protein